VAKFDKKTKFVFMPKTEALEKLQRYKNILFPVQLLKKINEYFAIHRDTPSWHARRKARVKDVEALVCLLSSDRTDHAKTIANQDIELQYYLWERFFYFEKALQDLPDDDHVFPADFGDFLKEGLIHSWRVREQRGWFD